MFTIDNSFRALQVQRQRTRGWRMPEGAIYVGRPTRWGNPYVVKKLGPQRYAVFSLNGEQLGTAKLDKRSAAELAVLHYRLMMERVVKDEPHALDELIGHQLACWCPVGSPCHRDVLIQMANHYT